MALALTPKEILDKGEYCLLAAAPHWERVPLGEVAVVQNGAAFKSKYFTHEDGLPLIRIRDVGKIETDNHYDGPYDHEYLVHPGEIIIGMDGDFKAAKWAGEVGLLNQRVCRLKTKSSHIDSDFLFYCLQPFLDAINAETSSVTVKHLSSRTVAEIPLPYPPVNEQRRIVAKIEELFSELDKGVESLKTARAQLKTYRQSLLKAAFEGRLTEQWRRDNADKLETAEQLLQRIRQEREARYQQQLEDWKAAVAAWETGGKPGKKPRKQAQPKFGDATALNDCRSLPDVWGIAKVIDIASVGTGVTPLKKRRDFYEGGSVPWVTSSAVNELYVRNPSGYVTETALEETNLRIYPKGTLLVAMYGEGKTRGKASELAIEATTNQALAAIVFQGDAEKIRSYLKWFLVHNYEQIRLSSSGGVQPNLNLGIVENTEFPLCPLEEQVEIVDQLESGISRISEMEGDIEAALRHVDVLRQAILKCAFEGKLVPQDPDDEPASVLLERIREEQADTSKPKRRKRKIGANA